VLKKSSYFTLLLFENDPLSPPLAKSLTESLARGKLLSHRRRITGFACADRSRARKRVSFPKALLNLTDIDFVRQRFAVFA
jgi:hypothetical protein